MNQQQVIDYVRTRGPQLGLDPSAVLAVGEQEGLSGGIGDFGTSFGPWQLHIGGALPSWVANRNTTEPGFAQSWAWSQEGVEYALQQMAGVAGGLSGGSAVYNLVHFFERSREDLRADEISNAIANLGQWASRIGEGIRLPIPQQTPTQGTTSATSGSNPAQSNLNLSFGDTLTHLSVQFFLVLLGLTLLLGGIYLLGSGSK